MSILLIILFFMIMATFTFIIFILAEHKEEVWDNIFFGDDDNDDL